jgi:hypothetical protein
MKAHCIAAAISALLILCGSSGPATAENYSDIWWNPSESGWGVTIADHETNLFAVLYVYRPDGRPVWYTIPGGVFSEGRRILQGDVYGTKGPPYTSAIFNSSLVTATKVGNAAFDFTPPGLAAGTVLLTYTINGVSQTKQIQRGAFGNAAPNWGTDRTDLWFNPDESGWGLSLANHGNNIFGVWYSYDTDGEPLWFVLPGGAFTGVNAFSGSLYRTTGPYFGNATFDPTSVVATNVGTAQINFTGPKSAFVASPKAQEPCPGFGASFVGTIGGQGIPLLICRVPFGNAGPGTPPSPPVTVKSTCSGSYQATTTFPTVCTSGGTRSFLGTFKINGISWFQLAQQSPDIAFQHFFSQPVEDSCVFNSAGVETCSCHDEYHDDDIPFLLTPRVDSDGITRGAAQVDIGIGEFDMSFQVFGGTTVAGTMTYHYQFVDGAPTYTGQGTFNCVVQ